MELTETKKVLIHLLQKQGVSENNTIAVILMLQEDEDAMEELAIWIYDNKPTEEEIMKEAIAMSDK